MINNKTGAGMHSSLMINGSQRMIFDPAGSFHYKSVPERNGVIFGITPKAAEMAMRVVMAFGTVGKAMCANSTSQIIARLPGFEHIRQTWYPRKLTSEFGKIPGVISRELYEYDDDGNFKVLAAWNPGG